MLIPLERRDRLRRVAGMAGVHRAVRRVRGNYLDDDHNAVEHRERVIDRLQRRQQRLDTGAAARQRRRLAAIGAWQTHREQP